MDGSQKLPQRILAPIHDRLAANQTPRGLCLAVAAWMRYVGGTDEQGKEIDVRDPLSARLLEASESGKTPDEKVVALLNVREVFGESLANNPRFRNTVTEWYRQISDSGARAAVKQYNASYNPAGV